MSNYDYAKLRPIEAQQIMRQGMPFYYLRDPLELSSQYLLVPQILGPVLAHCDGSHTVEEIQKHSAFYTGQEISLADVLHLLGQLDDVYLLDNDRAKEVKAATLTAYRSAPNRPPASAGLSYPAEEGALRARLQEYMDQTPEIEALESGSGLISPHIDYHRGGHVYAQAWKRVAKLAREADLVVFLATDHNGLPGTITLTRQNYATPFGVLPTDTHVIDRLAEMLGEDTVFESELHHRKEHSIELPAVWLHFIRDGKACPIVPILVGSFHHFIENGKKPQEDQQLDALISTIKSATAGQKVLVVASGDLAHLGPAFGGDPLDLAAKEQLKVDDDILLEPVFSGDEDDFFEIIREEKGNRNVCGTSPIYLTLRLMGDVTGEMIAYDRCVADQNDTSYVSVCGVTFA